MKSNAPIASMDSVQSVYREKTIEHLFESQMLVHDWNSGGATLDIYRPEIDRNRFDIVVSKNGITRFVQLKTSIEDGKTARQKVHVNLLNMTNGCVIWIVVDDKLVIQRYLAVVPNVGSCIGINGLKIAKHTKGNATGLKAERPNVRIMPKSHFAVVFTMADLFQMLFPGD